MEFAPFVKHREYVGHYDTIQSIEWSSDSRFFLTAAKDLAARIWSLDPEQGFQATTLAGHRQTVYGAWFSADQETIWTVSKDGALFQWQYSPPQNAPDTEDGMEVDTNLRLSLIHI